MLATQTCSFHASFSVAKTKCSSHFEYATSFLKALEEVQDEELSYVNIMLVCEPPNTKGKSFTASQMKQIMENAAVKKLSNFIKVSFGHWHYFNTKVSVELYKELNRGILRGTKIRRLKIDYDHGAMMSEEEVEALVQGTGVEHRELLPPLQLVITSSVGVHLLAHCLQLGWPIDKVSIKSKNFRKADFDWKQIKQLFEDSTFTIAIHTTAKTIKVDMFPIVDAVLSAYGEIDLTGFPQTENFIFALLDPATKRFRRQTKHQIKTLNMNFSNETYVYGIRVSFSENFLDLWGFISEMYASGEKRFLNVENLKIPRAKSLKEEHELFQSISNQNHSLLSCSIRDRVRTAFKIPQKLQKQFEVNLSKRMSDWIRSGTEVVYGRLKVMMVGQGRAGKSSTIRSLLNQPFDQDIPSTLVAEADKDISINVKDVSSKWEQTNLEKNWVAEEMGEYLNKVEHQVNQNGNNINIPVIATHQDHSQHISEEPFFKKVRKPILENEDVAKNVRMELNRKKNKHIQEKKGEKDNVRLTIWDFGGQQVFYALHHLYLTRGGIYVLVFDLSLMLKQKQEEMRVVNFWLDSIELHAPHAAVILVGTRANEVKEEDLEEIKLIDTELTNLIENKQVTHLEDEDLSFFPVDNSDEDDIEEYMKPLRARILGQGKVVGGKEENLNLWQKKVPLNWIYFMNHLVTKFEGCITANRLFDIGKQMGLNKERDIIPMLQFYQSAGAIIPFMKPSPINEPLISDYIVLSPEWLLKVLGSFIYDPELHKRKKALKNKKDMGRLINNYERSGILSKNLLLFILSEANVAKKDYGFILDLCQEMLIMSRFDFEPLWFTIPNDTFFLVPTMNQQVTTEEMIQEDAAVEDCVNIYLHFERAIPIGLFERVLCVMLTCNSDFDGSTMEPTITRNFAMFCFRETEVFLVDEHKNGDFRISCNKEEGSDLNIIINLLEIGHLLQEKLKSDVLGKHLDSSIDIKSLDGNGNHFRCSAEDLLTAVSKNKTRIKMRGSNGRQRMKPISQINFFGEAARLFEERKKLDAQRKQEALLLEKEKNKLKWEYDVFLAHTWGPNNVTHEQVVKIDKLLKEMKFRTWLDESNLKRFVANDIVDGLKKSSCILIFITELYLKKVENADTNASKEFGQAVKKGTDFMIPVVLDPECLDQKSWFGSKVGYHLTDALYIDFSSEEKIKANIGRLCERIKEMSKAERA